MSARLEAPVQLDTTIYAGATNQGATSGSLQGISSVKVTVSQQATVTALSAWIQTAGIQYRLGLYADSGGKPGALLCSTAGGTTAAGLNTLPVAGGPSLAPGTYHIALQTFSTVTGYWDSPGGGSVWYYNSQTYDASIPNPFPASASNATGMAFSFYATLNVPATGGGGGGGTTPPPSGVLPPWTTNVPPWTSYPPAQTTNPFVPPASFGSYPSKSASQQTAHINKATPNPVVEDGPAYSSLGGQAVSYINPNGSPVVPTPGSTPVWGGSGMGGGGGSGGGTTPPGTPGASVPIAGVQWISNGQPTGGSGAYAPYAQSVQYIHDNYAHDGDAILIPGGNYTWNAQVNITKAVIVQAQIMPQDVTQPGGNGNVFITHGGQSPFLFNFTLSPNGHQTLGGINFLPGTATQCYVQMGGQFTAPQTYVQRMYQCTFNIPNFQLSTPVQWFTNGGVIWKCHWFGSSSNSNNSGNGWGSGSGGIVLKSGIPWSNRQTFGTADAGGTSNTYIEDSMFSNLYNQGIDIDDNGRLVLRNSTLNNTQGLTHGVTSLYGGSMIEMYNCTLNYFACLGNAGSVYGTFAKSVGDGQTPSDGGRWPNQSRWFWWRGGTARIHDNTITQINNYGFWGGGLAWQFTNEDMTRPGSGSSNNTENNTAYNDTYGGGWHWCGSSGKTVGGTGSEMTPWNNYSAWQVKNPIYLWNDTFVGLNPLPESSNWSTADQTGYGHDPVTGVNTTADVFLLNRNLFLSAPPAGAGTVPGAYAPYTYPHPLRNV